MLRESELKHWSIYFSFAWCAIVSLVLLPSAVHKPRALLVAKSILGSHQWTRPSAGYEPSRFLRDTYLFSAREARRSTSKIQSRSIKWNASHFHASDFSESVSFPSRTEWPPGPRPRRGVRPFDISHVLYNSVIFLESENVALQFRIIIIRAKGNLRSFQSCRFSCIPWKFLWIFSSSWSEKYAQINCLDILFF